MSVWTRLALAVVAAAVVLGILGDMLLQETPWGLNVVVWTAVLMFAFSLFVRSKPGMQVHHGKWAAMPALLFAGMFAWRDSPVLKGLDAAGLIITLAMAPLCAQSLWIPFAGAIEYGIGIARSGINSC